MRDELEKLVAAGKINRQHVEPLMQLAQSGYCMHRSWGFGRITTVDTISSRFVIDFAAKPGHSMDLAFAAESLKPIPKEHILARKAADINSVRQMAALHHLDLIKIVLQSYGGKATLEQIQKSLVPDVISEDWRKWWEAARHELKKDGHFQLPNKKSEPVMYQPEVISQEDRLMGDFKAAKGLKARMVQTQEIIKSLGDFKDAKAVATQVIEMLNTEIGTHHKTMPALALEAIFVRDEVYKAAGIEADASVLTDQAVWSLGPSLDEVIDPMPTARHKQALHSFRDCNQKDWDRKLLESLNSASTKLCGEAADVLIEEGRLAEIKELVVRLISQHTASSELLLLF